MAAEAVRVDDASALKIVADGAHEPGDVICYMGKAAVVRGGRDAADGDLMTIDVEGVFDIDGTASKSYLRGTHCYFDRSANKIHVVYASGDFYAGIIDEDITLGSGGGKVRVRLGEKPNWTVGTGWDPSGNAEIQKILTAGTPEAQFIAGSWFRGAFSATAEAQNTSWLSGGSLPVTEKFIADIEVVVKDNGDAAALDLVLGIANDDHATDADSITESVLFSLDGNTLDLDAESDDGTTEVNATDTTVNLVEGTTHRLQIDMRNPLDAQLYVDGVNVLPDSVFAVGAAVGPWKLLFQMEKTSDDTPGEFRARGGLILMEDGAAV
jgi:predicted RecA/RadA family phage recombinase